VVVFEDLLERMQERWRPRGEDGLQAAIFADDLVALAYSVDRGDIDHCYTVFLHQVGQQDGACFFGRQCMDTQQGRRRLEVSAEKWGNTMRRKWERHTGEKRVEWILMCGRRVKGQGMKERRREGSTFLRYVARTRARKQAVE
jgi:hypothetical protein